MTVNIKKDISLSSFTSFGVGGEAETFAYSRNYSELLEILESKIDSQFWIIGYGSNILVSDEGLPGLVVCNRGGNIKVEDTKLIIDSGVWWDDVVKESIDNGLWGIELLSEIPGSVGAALFINIAAYGQTIGNCVEWIEAWNHEKKQIVRFKSNQLEWDYKMSTFQKLENNNLVIIRACLRLSKSKTTELTYQKALDVADELNLSTDLLQDRREIIIKARKLADSVWHPDQSDYSRTVGSFFRNPLVSEQQAKMVMQFDESGKTEEQLKNMNKIHGGNVLRVSAAHVMLASGFRRGESWGNVKLNDNNLLKIEAIGQTSAQEIYDVYKMIQSKCLLKLGIKLEPEARILGIFN